LPLKRCSSPLSVNPRHHHETDPSSSALSVNSRHPNETNPSSDPHETQQLTKEQVTLLNDLVPASNLAPRLRKSSIGSALTVLSEMTVDGQPMPGKMVGVQSDSDNGSDDSDAEMDVDGATAGVQSAGRSCVEGDSENDSDDDDSDVEEDGDEGLKEAKDATAPVQSAGKSGVEGNPDNGSDDGEQDEDDSDVEEDGDELMKEPVMADEANDRQEASQPSADSALADQLASFGLRRSSRNKQISQVVAPPPLPNVIVVRKPVGKKDRVVILVSVSNNAILQKLTTSSSGELGERSPAETIGRWPGQGRSLPLSYILDCILTSEDSSTQQCMPTLPDGVQPSRLDRRPIAMSLSR
jgi:hypothetical protein